MTLNSPPPVTAPENQIHSKTFTIPASLPKNSREVPIPGNTTRKIGHGKDSYQGIPGDGITPG